MRSKKGTRSVNTAPSKQPRLEPHEIQHQVLQRLTNVRDSVFTMLGGSDALADFATITGEIGAITDVTALVVFIKSYAGVGVARLPFIWLRSAEVGTPQ